MQSLFSLVLLFFFLLKAFGFNRKVRSSSLVLSRILGVGKCFDLTILDNVTVIIILTY